MKHVLFIVTSSGEIGTKKISVGYEFSEIADPYFEFLNQGFTIDFASISGGVPPEHGYDPTHPNSKKFRESSGFKRLNFSHKLDSVDVEAYDAIFFPGGLGPMVDMANNPKVKKIIKDFYEQGKIIGAVCHGPVALLDVRLSNGKKLLEGKKVTSFTESEEKKEGNTLGEIIPFVLEESIREEGGDFSGNPPYTSCVMVDDNVVTGQNPASAAGVANKMAEMLMG